MHVKFKKNLYYNFLVYHTQSAKGNHIKNTTERLVHVLSTKAKSMLYNTLDINLPYTHTQTKLVNNPQQHKLTKSTYMTTWQITNLKSTKLHYLVTIIVAQYYRTLH